MRTISRRMFIASSAIMALGVATRPASAAQPSPEQFLTRLDGLQTAYSRKYIADRQLGFATPVLADTSTPDVLTVTVLEFETPDQVAAAFDSTMNETVAAMILGRSGIELESTMVEDLGDQAYLYTGEVPVTEGYSDEPEYASLLAIQDGHLGILVQASSPDPSLEDSMMAFAEFMVDAEPGTDPIMVEGNWATGGTFDIMPGAEDSDVLNGLIPMYDYDLLLNGGTEPLDETHQHDGGTPEANPAG